MTVLLNILYFCLAFLITASDADSISAHDINTTRCILPPAPEHGSYTSSPAGAPGDSLDSVQLNVTCKLGYKLTGEGSVSCSRGQWTHPMPACQQFCLYNGRALTFFSHCVFATGEVFVRNGRPYDPNAPDDSQSQGGDKPVSCVLPRFPIYGSYVSTPQGSPGDSLPSFELNVTCKPDRELIGYSNISCVSGKMSHIMPLCLPPCMPVGNDAAILACEDVLDSTEKSVTPAVNNITTETTESTNNMESCVLPPYPQHGWYNSYPAEPPGTSSASYQLNITCAPEYKLVGQSTIKCIFGMMEGEMPVCLPYCKVEEKSAITCGEDEHRCILNNNDKILLTARTEDSYEECGLVGHYRNRRAPISGGYTPHPHEFPWHTGLYRKLTETIYRQICGGTLISTRVVVTAAHCFTLSRRIPSPTSYAVAVGKRFRRWTNTDDRFAQKSMVKEVKIPARYQGAVANFQEDIALVIADEVFEFNTFVRPACVSFEQSFDSEQLEPGNLGKIAGWGLTDEDASETRILQAASLPCISIDSCIETSPVSFRGSITADKFCAGYDNGTSACHGDSGGGFVVASSRNGETRYYLHGVISTSPVSDKACNIYTWITFTHILRHEHFIKSVAFDQ